jgi:hypothetical protein
MEADKKGCYDSNSIKDMKKNVVKITEDQIGDHPYVAEGFCRMLGYSSVEVELPPGYTNGNLIEKDGRIYLVFRNGPIKQQVSTAQ